MSEQPTLTTERLVLRPFVVADADDVMRMAGDPAIASVTLNIPQPYEPGMAEAWMATHGEGFAEGRVAVFAAARQADDVLVGATGLTVAPAHQRAELGYWVGQEHWGHGYATEAARAVLAFGFEQMGLRRIIERHFERNPASGRVLQKIGMHREGRFPQHIFKNDAFEDLVMYGLLREDAAGTP